MIRVSPHTQDPASMQLPGELISLSEIYKVISAELFDQNERMNERFFKTVIYLRIGEFFLLLLIFMIFIFHLYAY